MGERWSYKKIHGVMFSNLVTRYIHLVEIFLGYRVSADNLNIRVSSINGLEHLDSALKRGRGVVLLGFHFGSYGVPLAALGYKGYTVYQHVVLSHFYSGKSCSFLDSAVLKIKMRCHSAAPVKMLYHSEKNYARNLVRCLRENGILVIMGDGSRGTRFSNVNFMGKKISFSTGPASIAAITGAAILPVFTVREADQRHRVNIHAPIFVEGRDTHSIEEAVSCYTSILENYVMEYPGHWYTWDRLTVGRDSSGEEIIQPVVRKYPERNSAEP
ncbi:MAG: lysophospholipid acyltransferase family protein [Nitrospira sp.]|nr:lysophospholipid acyltransferase family protein [Nitrospira sp.]